MHSWAEPTTLSVLLQGLLQGSSDFATLRRNVTITGIGFWDLIHGQTGVAPNGIELHPVLSFAGTSKATSYPAAPIGLSQSRLQDVEVHGTGVPPHDFAFRLKILHWPCAHALALAGIVDTAFS